MHNRREFLKAVTAGFSVLAVGSVARNAEAAPATFANIIFTKDNPARWAGKEGIHVPQVTVTGSQVAVLTEHPMTDSHYIVRHTVVLENGTFLGAKTFTPVDKPVSSYDLPAGYKGRIFATSFCNLHDFWMNEAEI